MFELHSTSELLPAGRPVLRLPAREKRRPPASDFDDVALQTSLFAATLDEIDYGMLLVDGSGAVLQINRAARNELAAHPLRLIGNRLRARELRDMVPLHKAMLDACQHGRRRLLLVGPPAQRRTLAIVPLTRVREPGAAHALVMLARREMCMCLSVEAFARAHRLTWAETRVLKALASGARPNDIALQHDVELSTVRSQVRAIRAKTGAADIGSLLRQVALLPPMVGALHGDPGATEATDRVTYGHFGQTAPAARGRAPRSKIGASFLPAP
jgi:DNA-binding CsgD family transcriptional regulator